MAQLGNTVITGALRVVGDESATNLNVTNINGVAVGSSPKFTDNDKFVQQDNTDTSNWRKVVLGYQNNGSRGAATTSATNQVYVSPTVEVQSSTGTLATNKINTKAFVALTGSGTAGSDKGEGVSPRYIPSLWTFNSSITVANGEVYFIKIPVAGGTYGVWLSLNNGTNYYPVAVSTGTARFTTHYAANTVIAVTYESASKCNCYPKAGGDSRSDVTGTFRVLNDYDANTTYNFSGTTFVSGNKDTGSHDANATTANGHYYYSSNGPTTALGASTNDGGLYVTSHSGTWVGEIAQDYRNGNIFVRGKNNGTWTAWKKPDAGSVNGYTVAKSVPSDAVFTDNNNRKSFYGTCDTAGSTAAKVVTLTDTTGWELKAGTIVGVKFTNSSNTASNVTLNVNGTGAKSIWYNNAAYTGSSNNVCGYLNRITYYMYDGSTYWIWMSNSVDLNDNIYDRNKYTGTIKCSSTAIVAANIIVGNNGTYQHLKLGSAFDITYPILYAAGDIAASGTSTNNYDILHITITTTQSISLTAYKPVYIKGTLSGTTFTPIGTTPLTQTVPTAWDGYAYILLGMATAGTTMYLQERHPIYKFYSGAFREWNDFEGTNIRASGNSSHAEGNGTTAYASNSHAEGINTSASGNSSHAEGGSTRASAAYSHAEGSGTTASASGAHAEGINTSASGDESHAEGNATKALGDYSHAEGSGTTAYASQSHAEGINTSASGNSSHAEGSGTTASAAAAHAEGHSTGASSTAAHAEGYQTTAQGKYSHAEGLQTTASGEESHAEGYYTRATSSGAHAEGFSTSASGDYSHAEGYQTTAQGKYSHAEGYLISASGNYSHSEGWKAKALANDSHAEGYDTTASSTNSHAEGYCTLALGTSSHAEGSATSSQNANSHASGHYNAAMTTGGSSSNTTGTAFVIGNGTNSSTLKNAFSVQFSGVVKAASTITASTTADYAEYFEWYDHNPNNEDRVGYFVTFLNNNKIVIAEPESDYILGVTSGEPFVLGNGDCDVWNGMVLRDEFRRVIYEPAPLIDEETGKQVIDEYNNPVYQGTRPKYNPDYDPTIPYINRADRPEWTPVGMLGVLAVRDDGTCEVNHYATIGEGGIATKAIGNNQNRYRVIHRNSPNVVEIVFR